MKTYRFVSLFAMLSVMAIATHAADVTTVVNAKIAFGGEELLDRTALANLEVVAYVDGQKYGEPVRAQQVLTPVANISYYPVSLTLDETNVGKSIEMHLIVADRTEYDWAANTVFSNICEIRKYIF